MATNKRMLLKNVATRGVIATLPVAMASAYASGIFLSPPREVRIDYVQVAEITNSSSTVGLADSALIYKSPAEINKTLDELQSLGVNDIRVLVPWAVVEQSDNVYYWTQMDAVMSAAAARNMRVMADINSTPLWAAAPDTFPGAGAPKPADLAAFVQQVVTRYGSTISAYEIWNEPNWAAFYQPIDPVAYTALLAAVYPIIKNPITGDPTATVVAGALGAGMTTPWTMSPVDFVAGMMAAGAGNYFDALSFHPYQETLPFSAGYTYPGLGTPLEQLDAIKTLIGTAKSVWISEYGLPTSDVSQQQQSDYIKDLLDYWQTYSQTGPVFLYTAQDAQTGTTNPEDNYGLFTTNWTPKLAAQMLQAWIAAHPQTPTGPTTPTNPSTPQLNPVAALLQALGQQIAAAINQFVTLGQTIINAITNFVSSITAALTGIVAPPATATPVASLALRVASVAAPEAATRVAATTPAVDSAASVSDEAAGDATGAETPAVPVTKATSTPVAVADVAVSEPALAPVPAKPAVTEAPAVEAESPSVTTTPAETVTSSNAATSSSTVASSGAASASGAAAEKADADGPGKSDSDDGVSTSSTKTTTSGAKSGSETSGSDKVGATTSDGDQSGSATPSRLRKIGQRLHRGTGTSSAGAGAKSSSGSSSSGADGGGSAS